MRKIIRHIVIGKSKLRVYVHLGYGLKDGKNMHNFELLWNIDNTFRDSTSLEPILTQARCAS